MFNVTDNLKKLMNKKTDSVFTEIPKSETIPEQSKEFFSKIYGLDSVKENIFRVPHSEGTSKCFINRTTCNIKNSLHDGHTRTM